MTTGIVLLNFGEPAAADREAVVEYLERIFMANADLEAYASTEAARERSRTLAERRAPGLVAEYEAIGGSPLNEQARATADALEDVLRERGFAARTYLGLQYTEPFVEDAATAAVADGVDRIVGFPGYPLCGPSTTVLALDELEAAVESRGWDGPFHAVTGWHRYPPYNRLRAENVAAFAADADLELAAPDTAMVFSAHGTPTKYLEAGSRYDVYVEEYCATIAGLLSLEEYHVGYQNHGNREIPWTEPPVEDVIAEIEAERVVVEPVSFLHEQSETLAELDVDLADDAAEAGLSFHRVPIPHGDPRLPGAFADLLEPFVADLDPGYYGYRGCACREEPGSLCLCAPRAPGDGVTGTPVGAGDADHVDD